jgi:transmembrane sensor
MSAREIEQQAALWLVRREEPEWTAADEAMLAAWLEESMAHKAAFWRLEFGWREADRIRALGTMSAHDRPPLKLARARWAPAALAASLLVALTFTVMQAADRPQAVEVRAERYATPLGGRGVVRLDDGSEVELNTATALRAAVSEARREVWLDRGEAFFEVRHDARLPFVVHAGSRTITVLGTKFAVRRDAERVTVTVLEGRVRVDDSASLQASPAVIMTPGDVAIARGASTLLAEHSEERVEDALAWRSGMLSFDQASLADAAAEFNRYNRKRIVIDDPAVAGMRIGGTFQAANVDAFVRLLHDAYGLKIVENADEVRISA